MATSNNINMLPAGALSLGSSVQTPWFYMRPGTLATIQAAWTGTPVGNLSIQVSNEDIKPNPDGMTLSSTPAIPTDVTSSAIAAGGAAGNWGWAIPPGYANVRLIYTSTSGTGSLTSAQLVLKG